MADIRLRAYQVEDRRIRQDQALAEQVEDEVSSSGSSGSMPALEPGVEEGPTNTLEQAPSTYQRLSPEALAEIDAMYEQTPSEEDSVPPPSDAPTGGTSPSCSSLLSDEAPLTDAEVLMLLEEGNYEGLVVAGYSHRHVFRDWLSRNLQPEQPRRGGGPGAPADPWRYYWPDREYEE